MLQLCRREATAHPLVNLSGCRECWQSVRRSCTTLPPLFLAFQLEERACSSAFQRQDVLFADYTVAYTQPVPVPLLLNPVNGCLLVSFLIRSWLISVAPPPSIDTPQTSTYHGLRVPIIILHYPAIVIFITKHVECTVLLWCEVMGYMGLFGTSACRGHEKTHSCRPVLPVQQDVFGGEALLFFF